MTETTSPDDWYSAADAQEAIGLSRRQLDRLAKSGEITTVMRAGKKRYRCEDVDGLEVAEAAPVVNDALAVLKQTQNHLEAVMRHYDKLVTNINAPLETLTKAWKDEMIGMRSRVVSLEGVHLEIIKERESLASDSMLRGLAETEHSANQARKEEAWTTFKEKLLPRLLGGGESGLQKFLGTFNDEQIEALISSEFLAPEQKEIIRQFRGNASNGAGNGASEAPTKGSN